mgnify:CR=1 FL=1
MASYAPPNATIAEAITKGGAPATHYQPTQTYSNTNSTSAGADEDEAPLTNEFVRTRRLTVSFESTPSQLATQTEHSTWRMADSNVNAFFFGVKGFGDRSMTARMVDVKQVRFHQVRALKTFSTMPYAVNLDLTGVKGNGYTKAGRRVGLTVFPGTNTTPEVMLEKSSVLDSTFTECYPNYTASNLRTLGINKIPSDNSFMITLDHPVIGVLRTNPEILQGNETIDMASLHHGCYTLSAETTEHVLGMVEKAIVSRLPDVDCTNFQATVSRSDGLPFATETEVATLLNTAKKDALAASLLPASLPVTLSVELEVTFEPI